MTALTLLLLAPTQLVALRVELVTRFYLGALSSTILRGLVMLFPYSTDLYLPSVVPTVTVSNVESVQYINPDIQSTARSSAMPIPIANSYKKSQQQIIIIRRIKLQNEGNKTVFRKISCTPQDILHATGQFILALEENISLINLDHITVQRE